MFTFVTHLQSIHHPVYMSGIYGLCWLALLAGFKVPRDLLADFMHVCKGWWGVI